jgi:chromosome segregation ATPase
LITVYNVMLVTLGALLAALALLFLMPAYRRRIERFTLEQIKRSLPITENEIRADKDRLRAEFALEVHKLESRLDEAAVTAARQAVEVNRRDARITELEQLLETRKTDVEEHQNARRVLEQTILDRLPKVESRLAEARRMLLQRDGEIASLTQTSARQTQALEQATQINVQLTGQVERLRAALETRAARNREAIGDPRFDGEVALRSEIEALRAKTRDQAQMIDRFQVQVARGDEHAESEVERLQTELARVEGELIALRTQSRNALLIDEMEEALHDQAFEITRLKAALQAYEDGADAAAADAGDALAAKAELNALTAQVKDQESTIDALRSELAAANERLSRQAQHFREEMRRLSVQPETREESPAWPSPSQGESQRRSLAERIAQPRQPRDAAADAAASGSDLRAKYLKAVTGSPDPGMVQAAGEAAAPLDKPVSPRRPRLLDRISNLDKSG